jgi:uncharacterized protein (DUF488 family)
MALQKKKKKTSHKKSSAKNIYTLGYQGISILQYIDILQENNISLVCDVRNNPFSFKLGFSKKKFIEFLSKADIKYRHFPALGVDRIKRKEAGDSPVARRKMFRFYSKVILDRPAAVEEMDELTGLLDSESGLVLTCYEKDPSDCHRSFLADKIQQKIKNLKIIHLQPVE